MGTLSAADLEEASTGRTLLWDAALQDWQKNPWFGNGWGSFFFAWPGGRTTSILAHNELFQLLCEVGLLGAIAFVGVELSSFVTSFKVARRVMDMEEATDIDRDLVTFACAYQVFELVYGYSTGTLLQPSYVFVPYFLAIGIAFSYFYWLKADEQNSQNGLPANREVRLHDS